MVLLSGRLPKKAQVLQCHLMNSPGFGVAIRIPSKPQLCPHLTPSRKAWSGWNLRYYPGRFFPCFVYKHKKAADLLRNLRIGVERKKGEKRWPEPAMARVLHVWVDPQGHSGQSAREGGLWAQTLRRQQCMSQQPPAEAPVCLVHLHALGKASSKSTQVQSHPWQRNRSQTLCSLVRPLPHQELISSARAMWSPSWALCAVCPHPTL